MPGRAGSGCKHPTQLLGAASIPSDTSSRVAAPCHLPGSQEGKPRLSCLPAGQPGQPPRGEVLGGCAIPPGGSCWSSSHYSHPAGSAPALSRSN